jgi:hypothetical protein
VEIGLPEATRLHALRCREARDSAASPDRVIRIEMELSTPAASRATERNCELPVGFRLW